MPLTTRIFVQASIVYLAVGAVLGSILLINRWIPLGPGVAVLRASHIEMLLVGWLTQLILGVAWWLFPPLKTGLRSGGPKPALRGQSQRGIESLFWATFVALNAGVLLRAFGEPLFVWTRADLFRRLAPASDLLVLAAALCFVLNVWHRVRELGRG